MNHLTDPLFDSRIAAWLEEDPSHAPDQALDTILAAVPSISQRRRLPVLWRFTPMPKFMKLAAAAVIGVIALGILYINLPRPGSVGGPSPSPTATAGPSPTADLLDTARWTTFTSTRYAFGVAFPEGWTATPAARDFVLDTDRLVTADQASSDLFIDQRVSGDAQILFSAFAATVPVGKSETAWIDEYHAPEPGVASDCKRLAAEMTPIVIDGQPSRLGTNCDWYDAFVLVGNRVYVFTVWRPNQRELVDAFLSTVQLP